MIRISFVGKRFIKSLKIVNSYKNFFISLIFLLILYKLLNIFQYYHNVYMFEHSIDQYRKKET